MNLYFFINNILRRFVAKNYSNINELNDFYLVDDKEISILKDSISMEYPDFSNFKNSKIIIKKLLKLILNESFIENL